MLLLAQLGTEQLNKPTLQLNQASGFFWVVCIAGGLAFLLLVSDLIRDHRKKTEFRHYWERRHTPASARKTLVE